MFVSKKKYDALLLERDDWKMRYNIACKNESRMAAELVSLKASRARSNENLKLGTAASAKARRMKVVGPVDWAKPIEAYHPDGRVEKVRFTGPSAFGNFTVDPALDGRRDCFKKDGSYAYDGVEWRIRNA